MDKNISWIDLVVLELGTIDKNEILDPKTPVSSREEVIGPVDTLTQKLYTLWQYTIREKNKNKGYLDFENHTDEEENQINKEIAKLYEKENVLKTLFWYRVHEQSDTWGCTIGIRTGFTVVKTKGTNLLTDFLENIFKDLND